MQNHGETYLTFLTWLPPFKSQNSRVYFLHVLTLETRFSTNPVFVKIYFQILCSKRLSHG